MKETFVSLAWVQGYQQVHITTDLHHTQHVASEEEEEPQEADRHGEDETDGHMLLEQSIIDVSKILSMAT